MPTEQTARAFIEACALMIENARIRHRMRIRHDIRALRQGGRA